MFEDLDTVELQTVADTILAAPRTGVFGVGALLPLARHFCYVGSMAVPGLWALPTNEGLPIDDIGRMGAGDVLIAMTFAPYRAEIVEATRLARARDITVVTVTDSRTAPPALDADHVFTTPAETPLFFASVLGVVALLETLLAFMVADSRTEAAEAIDQFHQHRRAAGVYVEE